MARSARKSVRIINLYLSIVVRPATFIPYQPIIRISFYLQTDKQLIKSMEITHAAQITETAIRKNLHISQLHSFDSCFVNSL